MQPSPDVTAPRRAAALRLKHDLGKYVRFSAPKEPERSVEALRKRLALDLLATRRTDEETLSAVALFDRWEAEDGSLVSGDGLDEEVSAIRDAIGTMRVLLPGLGSLEEPGLRRLDEASRVVSERCVALWKRVAEAEG
jgi:hypothetical protein